MNRFCFAVLTFLASVSLTLAQTSTPQEEFLNTSSYAIASAGESGVSGDLLITELAEGGTRWTVKLTGVAEGKTYAAVAFRGGCGSLLSQIAELNAVVSNAAHVSISVTEVDVPLDLVISDNYSLNIYNGERDAQLVACAWLGD